MNHVVPDDELLDAARKVAAAIALNDASSVRRMKKVIDEGFGMTLADGLQMEAQRAGKLNANVSADAVEKARGAAQARARSSLPDGPAY